MSSVEGLPATIVEVIGAGGPTGPQGPPGPPGASTLTDLTDVTGTGGLGTSPVDDGTSTFPLTRVTTQDDLDQILASVAAVNWRTLDLQPGFGTYEPDPSFATPKYRLTLNNVVHVEGMVGCSPPLSDDDAGKVLATLAADSRPDGTLLFGCPAYGNNARFDVLPTGDIVFQGMLIGGGQIDWFSLSVVTFSVGGNSVARDALAAVFG